MAAPEGYKTLGKIGISYKGDYNSNTAYERLDAVLHNGSTYLALVDAPDGAPRDDKINWIYLAKGFSSDIGDSEITFTEAEARENINTGESVKTVFGKVKKWLAGLAAAAFMQVITSYADLMAGTALDNYLVGAAAVKEGLTEVNSKLIAPDYKSAVAIQSNYTCMTNGYVIGTIQGAVNGWASIRSSKNANYFLALCTSSENPIAVCIPFASGDSVIFGSSGTYNLAFAPAK